MRSWNNTKIVFDFPRWLCWKELRWNPPVEPVPVLVPLFWFLLEFDQLVPRRYSSSITSHDWLIDDFTINIRRNYLKILIRYETSFYFLNFILWELKTSWDLNRRKDRRNCCRSQSGRFCPLLSDHWAFQKRSLYHHEPE